jgi:hypothetical protein
MLNSTSTSSNLKSSITFLIQPSHGLTKHLHRRLQSKHASSPTFSASHTIPLLLEGPYGASPPPCVYTADTIIAIAGGIGITAIMGYLNLYLSGYTGPHQRPLRAGYFRIFWSARSASLIAAIRSQLPQPESLRAQGVGAHFVCTAAEPRLDICALIEHELRTARELAGGSCDVVVITCGPGSMADAVRGAVVRNLEVSTRQRGRVDVLEEAFSW